MIDDVLQIITTTILYFFKNVTNLLSNLFVLCNSRKKFIIYHRTDKEKNLHFRDRQFIRFFFDYKQTTNHIKINMLINRGWRMLICIFFMVCCKDPFFFKPA